MRWRGHEHEHEQSASWARARAECEVLAYVCEDRYLVQLGYDAIRTEHDLVWSDCSLSVVDILTSRWAE
jgi:hypothetical protein